MDLLTHDEIVALHAAALSAGLLGSRWALLAGIHAGVVGRLPLAPAPSDQLMCDLAHLNAAGTLADGSAPLAVWLLNAAALAAPVCEGAIFEAARARCAASARIGSTGPRVLAAGPWFGLTADGRAAIERILREPSPPGRAALRIREMLRGRSEVIQAQLVAIARHDVIVDLSPWRAFARWWSIGLHRDPDADAGPRAARLVQIFPDDAAVEPESALDRIDAAVWTHRRALDGLVADHGLAVAGLEGAEHLAWVKRLVLRWPECRLVVEPGLADELGASLRGRVAPARFAPVPADLGLGDYLRALRVAAGQVRLSGAEEERPIADVFVEMEIVVGLDRLRDERHQVAPIAADPARSPDEGEHSDEMRARALAGPVSSSSTEMLRASRLLMAGQRIMLWGEAGTGKSTLLRWLSCEAAAPGTGVVPIWVTSIPGPQLDFADQLVEGALRAVGLPEQPDLRGALRRAIHEGHAILFLDGLDEAHPLTRETLPELLCKAATITRI